MTPACFSDGFTEPLFNGLVVLGGGDAEGKHDHRAQQDTCL